MSRRLIGNGGKRKEMEKRETEQNECAKNQQDAQDEGFCCYHHAKKMKLEEEEERQVNKRLKVDGPDHCIHCNDDPCAFLQIKSCLCANDELYFDKEEFENSPVAYNSSRRKRAYQLTAFVLWGGINYRQKHYTCVEIGVRALFPPLDGKVMGFKNV